MILPVIDRLDFAMAERWLEALGDIAPSGVSPLTTAELMLAVAQSDYRRGLRIADQLAALGDREELARSSARAAALMAWCYLNVARTDDVDAVLAVAERTPATDAARYAATLVADSPEGGKPLTPELTGGPLDALVIAARSLRGRFAEPGDAPVSRWVATVAAPWRIEMLRAAGHTEQALELYEAGTSRGRPGRSASTR